MGPENLLQCASEAAVNIMAVNSGISSRICGSQNCPFELQFKLWRHVGRMTIITLADGGLFLHSRVPLDAGLRAALDEIGPASLFDESGESLTPSHAVKGE